MLLWRHALSRGSRRHGAGAGRHGASSKEAADVCLFLWGAQGVALDEGRRRDRRPGVWALEGPLHVRAGVIPASRTDIAAHTVSGSCQKHAAAPRRRAHVTFALVHVPRDDGLRYRIHMLMQTRAAPMPYMCKTRYVICEVLVPGAWVLVHKHLNEHPPSSGIPHARQQFQTA